MSLLNDALGIPSNQRRKNVITEDEIELALAWLEDRVSMKQVSRAIGHSNDHSARAWLSTKLREAYRRKIIVIS